MSVGENIKKYRKAKKLTQKELAEKIDKNERTVRAYEANDTVPPLSVIEKIATVLNITSLDIIELDEHNMKSIMEDALNELVTRTKEETMKAMRDEVPQWTKIGFEDKFKSPFEFWSDVIMNYPNKFCTLSDLFNDKNFDNAIDEIAKFLEVAFDTKVKEIVNRIDKNKQGQK